MPAMPESAHAKKILYPLYIYRRKKDKQEEKPNIEVKKGLILETEKYKYLGDLYNENGEKKEKLLIRYYWAILRIF